jgi:hypothetical protein
MQGYINLIVNFFCLPLYVSNTVQSKECLMKQKYLYSPLVSIQGWSLNIKSMILIIPMLGGSWIVTQFSTQFLT